MNSVRLTDHAKDQLKERAGLPAAACQKAAVTAWENGVRQNEVAGALARFLGAMARDYPGKDVRVYAEKVWCFHPNGALITVMHLQRQYVSAANKAQARKREEDREGCRHGVPDGGNCLRCAREFGVIGKNGHRLTREEIEATVAAPCGCCGKSGPLSNQKRAQWRRTSRAPVEYGRACLDCIAKARAFEISLT